jgi:uncharacterized LabA/DUF88 family protein
MGSLLLRWRYFWSRRAPKRIAAAVMLWLLALLAAIYSALPTDIQRQVGAVIALAGERISSLDVNVLLSGVAALCALLALAFIFWRPYRRHSYLATDRASIPPVSVYLDAENQLSSNTIRRFSQFLMEHLDGRRADLLYFLDASATATHPKYKELYRFGFRPVDVPHDPTGEGTVKEAVDREIDMHAYERALLGPAEQEFIIITGDGDFVPLVYRLRALGHSVQIWATPIRDVYRTLASYIDVRVLDLAQIIRELPDVSEAEEALYRAIKDTLKARERIAKQRGSARQKRDNFLGQLSGGLKPTLASVGYSGGKYREYWLEHLTALSLIQPDDGKTLPGSGSAEPLEAARQMFAMAYSSARSVERLATSRADQIVSMEEVGADLAAEAIDDSAPEAPLRRLLQEQPGKRRLHARYLARCARGLGLIAFEDVSLTADTIKFVSSQRQNGQEF